MAPSASKVPQKGIRKQQKRCGLLGVASVKSLFIYKDNQAQMWLPVGLQPAGSEAGRDERCSAGRLNTSARAVRAVCHLPGLLRGSAGERTCLKIGMCDAGARALGRRLQQVQVRQQFWPLFILRGDSRSRAAATLYIYTSLPLPPA